MTHIEENIVNISMCAALLLKDGRIELDEQGGFAGLTDYIVDLAEKFEKAHAGVDWHSDDRDYWIEVDDFAEKELLEQYGIARDVREQEPQAADLNVKVIIADGIVEGVLKDSDAPISVEIVDVDRNYENYKALESYREELYKDRSLKPCDYVIAGMEEEARLEVLENQVLREDPVKVFAVAGSVKHELYSGNLDECKAFCQRNDWRWVDENEFAWDLEMEDSRDDLMPEDYFDALSYYSDKEGYDVEGEFTRFQAEKLVTCYHNKLTFNDLCYWVGYEAVCGEDLTCDEYKAVHAVYNRDPYDIGDEDFGTINAIKQVAKDFRAAQAGRNEVPALEQLIQAAEEQKTAPVDNGELTRDDKLR